MFCCILLQSVYTATIPENSPDGTSIGTAYAFDADRPDSNGFNDVRYYMDDNRFDVDPLTVSSCQDIASLT